MNTFNHLVEHRFSRMGLLALALVLSVSLVACNGEAPDPDPEPEDPATIVDIAMADERFSTLVTAIDSAGIGEVLQEEGPYTVFAPTNDAFDELPEGTLDDLLDPDNRDELQELLTYHVAEGDRSAADLQELESTETLQGSDVSIRVEDDELFIGDARVVQPGVTAGNGVIHAIDAVLALPDDDD